MKLIVGLGNPGAEYERTRHNAGFMAVDRLIARHAAGVPLRAKFHSGVAEAAIPGVGKVLLQKPITYMNRSGLAVLEALNFYKLSPAEDLLVIVDDIALPIGSFRIRASGGDGGHNGLGDISRVLGGADYPRLRLGIGAPGIVPQKDYVLRRFSQEQLADLDPALEKTADASEHWAREGADAAMNIFNTKSVGFAPKPQPDSEPNPDTASNGAA